jgi:hypothetical protein
MYLRVGEFNRKHGERTIGFAIDVREDVADQLWDELAENFKKNCDEIGPYEFEVTHPNDSVQNAKGEASIILEMPVRANRPEKIRNMIFLFGRLLHEFGYPITSGPEIFATFDNADRKLQKIAKSAFRAPKIKPPGER